MAEEGSEPAATRLIDKIDRAIAFLVDLPLSGPARDELAPGLRVKFQGAYAVYYRPMTTEILIVRVLHGARDAFAIAGRGGLSSS